MKIVMDISDILVGDVPHMHQAKLIYRKRFSFALSGA